jgi:hypothetical protein
MTPAPELFVNLSEHLVESGVDVATLRKAISTYLDLNENLVSDEVTEEVDDDLQAFYYREMLSDFLASIS